MTGKHFVEPRRTGLVITTPEEPLRSGEDLEPDAHCIPIAVGNEIETESAKDPGVFNSSIELLKVEVRRIPRRCGDDADIAAPRVGDRLEAHRREFTAQSRPPSSRRD